MTASGDTSEADTSTNAITTMQTPGTADPVVDATVTVYPFDPDASGDETLEPIKVDANGEYSITDLPVGTHGFVAEADGFVSDTQQVTIEQGVTTDDADFDLEYADGGTVSGTVSLDEVDPAEDVTVTVALEETDDETTVPLEADTDSAAFTIDDVDVDVDDGYTVIASPDSENYGDALEDTVMVDVGETADVGNLVLERDTGGAEGTVTASGDTASSGGTSTDSISTMSTPIAGENVDDATVTVHYFDTDASGDGDVTVDVTDGSFSVDQLPVGTHGFAVDGSGLESDTRTETIKDGTTKENVDFDLDYAAGGALSGSVSIPEPADGDFPVDVTVRDGEQEVASEEVTIADGDSSVTYTFENVDVNVDNGYTVSVTTDAFESAPEQESVIVDVGDETTGVDIDLTDPVAQQVDIDASDTTTTVGEWVEFTATVTNNAGTPVEGVTVEATDDGEDVDYRNGDSSQTTNEDGEASFEATTETEQQVDSIQFTFTEQDNQNEGIEYGVHIFSFCSNTFGV
ncbi:hypothetical protein EL22_26810 [Halostagnicola sp. A56]|uniref:carboxypeptidase-like regulatory domain-containing protein n=1 Tax=Halostagnicola sp. A56 TaxID=1495067 RepID=UPI00065F6ACD|nr:carboxypeptidase-like regulatory domain-containing protein [Halostagnicola sp. A56]KMT45838.1 hypothetical protein EL22_26810 [Halostagnicola sp. A56]